MYRKRKTLTVPVEYNEVVVPFAELPDDTDIRFVWRGQEVEGEQTDEGVLIGTSQKAEEQVVIEYDWVEEKDTTSPVVKAIKENAVDFNIEPLIEAVERVVEAVENKTVTEYDDGRVVALLQDIQKSLQQPQEKKDYTAILERIVTTLDTPRVVEKAPVERETLAPILEEIKALLAVQKDIVLQKEIDFPMHNGRIKVEVDRAGVGGLTSEEAKDLRELNEKQDELITAISSIGGTTTAKTTLYERDAEDMLLYKGTNATEDASESATDWTITKYTRDVDGNLESKDVKTGSWTGRVALFT